MLPAESLHANKTVDTVHGRIVRTMAANDEQFALAANS